MKLHFENSRAHMSVLANCIDRDPSSLEGWSLLHIAHSATGLDFPSVHSRDLLLSRVFSELQEYDGMILAGLDGDLLIVCHALDEATRNSVAERVYLGIHGELPARQVYQAYDIEHEPDAACRLLSQKADLDMATIENSRRALHQGAAITHDEVAAMRHVLSDSKASRWGQSHLQALLVEDDDLTRRVASNVLKRDCELTTAKDAYEAVVDYLLYAPDIVFLDIDLPDESGFLVLDQIMACDPDAYVVMFSSHDTLDNIVGALSRGAQGFVTKPFHKHRLKHYITARSVIAPESGSAHLTPEGSAYS